MFIMVCKGWRAVIISHIAELLYQRDPGGLMSATECSDLEVGHTYPSYSQFVGQHMTSLSIKEIRTSHTIMVLEEGSWTSEH